MDTNCNSMSKEQYISQIAEVSGVTKKNIRKVLSAVSEVTFKGMASGMKVPVTDGIIMTGVVKNDSQRKYYDCQSDKTKQSDNCVRPKCIFTRKGKYLINKHYCEMKKKGRIT